MTLFFVMASESGAIQYTENGLLISLPGFRRNYPARSRAMIIFWMSEVPS